MRSGPSTCRRRETYVSSVCSLLGGGRSPQSPSISRSRETRPLLASSKIASSARCLGPPSACSLPSTRTLTGPSRPNSTALLTTVATRFRGFCEEPAPRSPESNTTNGGRSAQGNATGRPSRPGGPSRRVECERRNPQAELHRPLDARREDGASDSDSLDRKAQHPRITGEESRVPDRRPPRMGRTSRALRLRHRQELARHHVSQARRTRLQSPGCKQAGPQDA